ncbi:MAG: DUF2017 family protein [Actinomycetota bacterium]
MPEFEWVPEEGLRARIDADERSLLLGLLEEMQTLLEEPHRADSVERRLFPDAYDDENSSAAFHELVGTELRDMKRNAVRLMKERLGGRGTLETSIPEDEIQAWLTGLTDLRLAIGTRLDVTEQMMSADVDPEEPAGAALSVLHWLGWLQESILAEISD